MQFIAHRLFGFLLVGLVVAGCSTAKRLPVTPNLLADGSGTAVLSKLPPARQTPDMEILYVTDRNECGKPDAPAYGYSRAMSVYYGVANVHITPETDWATLARDAGQPQDTENRWLEVRGLRRLGQFRPDQTRVEYVDGELRRTPECEAARAAEFQRAQDFLAGYLRPLAPEQRDVYLYVHGFNNDLEEAVARLAGVWHFLGRKGVAIAYSWPARQGNLLDYFCDRESGEYTIYHLKETIRAISECPEVARLHIITHSRGADVTATALRELNLEIRGRGPSPRQKLKLETFVMAAPDLDAEVFLQRFIVENLAGISRRTVVYTSPDDKALGLVLWLFRGTARVGRVDLSLLPCEVQELLGKLPNLQIVQCPASGLAASHSYAFTNAAVLSDLILVLRDRKDPGKENGRPLTPINHGWKLDDSYCAPPAK